MDGPAPGRLITYSNLFIVAVTLHTSHMLCVFAIVDCTHAGLATASCNKAQEKTTKQTANVLVEGSAMAFFGLGNNFPGGRTLQTKLLN